MLTGDPAGAAEVLDAARDLLDRLPDRYGAERSIEMAAWLAGGRRAYRRAAALLGAAGALRSEIGSAADSARA